MKKKIQESQDEALLIKNEQKIENYCFPNNFKRRVFFLNFYHKLLIFPFSFKHFRSNFSFDTLSTLFLCELIEII